MLTNHKGGSVDNLHSKDIDDKEHSSMTKEEFIERAREYGFSNRLIRRITNLFSRQANRGINLDWELHLEHYKHQLDIKTRRLQDEQKK